MEAKRTKKRTKKKRRRIVAKFRQQTNDPQRNNQQGTVFSLLRNQTKPNRTKPNQTEAKHNKRKQTNNKELGSRGSCWPSPGRTRSTMTRWRTEASPCQSTGCCDTPGTKPSNVSAKFLFRTADSLFVQKKKERERVRGPIDIV